MKRYLLVENTTGSPSGLRILGEADSVRVKSGAFAEFVFLSMRIPVREHTGPKRTLLKEPSE